MEDLVESEAERAVRLLLYRVSYKPGWAFGGEPASALFGGPARLIIRVQVTDSLSGLPMEVCHRIPIPPVPMSERALRRWLFEQIVLVERHEAMEFFKVDGRAPYFPDHTRGGDPYALVDRDRSLQALEQISPGDPLRFGENIG